MIDWLATRTRHNDNHDNSHDIDIDSDNIDDSNRDGHHASTPSLVSSLRAAK